MICPVCGTWAGPFSEQLLSGHHADCELHPKNIITSILSSRDCRVFMPDDILERCERWLKLETT